MELTWHGHATWHVEVGETSLLIDPFFDNPHTSLDPSDVEQPDYVLLTHGHADHVGDAGHFSDATLVAVPELAAFAEDEFGFEDAVGGMGMNLGGTVECGDAYVTMHRADHTSGINTGYEYSAGPPVGYVISDTKPTQVSDEESETFYHAGDTGLMTEMRDVIGPHLEPDAAAVPAGDHFTMGPMQAAIAVDWLDVDHAFPMHYDTFPPIEIDTDDFVNEVKGTGSDAEAHVLDGDETFDLSEGY
ncbi:metal-dependent hydrolase [Halostella pelagica]|uniref:metal-dependent hydrolase n=1 Tax=Halostella pelagica TaxID=2583824 RepID=UPI0010811158|nr:metal-dependent hydrolase [Halostella pelagica]